MESALTGVGRGSCGVRPFTHDAFVRIILHTIPRDACDPPLDPHSKLRG